MTVTTTDKWWGEKLKIVQKENESLKQELLEKFKEEYEQEEEGGRARLKIAGKGGSPGQPYDDPEKGKGPFVPAPPRDKLASLQIRPNQIMLPFVPKEPETDDMYGDGVDEIEGSGSSDLAGLNLGGGRFLHNYEIKMLRDHFTGASEKERNRLIEMYSDKPFRGLV